MNLVETIRTGLGAIRTHALRSTLTVVGILIGIAAVILTVGLGLGTQKDVSEQISSLGANLLIITPGASMDSSGVRMGFGSGTALTQLDAQALASRLNAPDIAGVAPEKTASSQTLENSSTTWTVDVVGTTPEWLSVRARTLSSGQFITEEQNTTAAAVMVLGSETAQELFGSTNVVGRTVTIGETNYEVIGVLASAGSSSSTNLDDMAIVPLSTVAAQLSSSNPNSVSTIYVQAASTSQLSAAYQEADTLLSNLHAITDADSKDYTIASQDALVSTATSVYRTLTVLLVGIAAISLLVGGIGVMNIMLVSVSERTREIGLRKALGAAPGAIRRQFLTEAMALGLAGGVLGAGLGILGAELLPKVLDSSVVISGPAVAGSILIALAIGVVFGVYPATRAARLAPIDALRSE